MKVYFLLATLMMAASVSAQELPDAPKPKRAVDHRIFIAGVSLLAASKSADMWTTRSVLDRGGWENNPVFGKHPSNARLAGIQSLFFAGQSTLFYFSERSPHPLVRWTGRAYIGLTIFTHAKIAACNSGINVHSAHMQSCHPFLPF